MVGLDHTLCKKNGDVQPAEFVCNEREALLQRRPVFIHWVEKPSDQMSLFPMKSPKQREN